MSICIEPTRAEIVAAGKASANPGELHWAPWLANIDVAWRTGKTEKSFQDLSFAIDLLIGEGQARGLLGQAKGDRRDRAYYAAMRMDGASHKLAEMFSARIPPMSNTDREFLEGHCNGNQFEGMPMVGNWYKRQAAQAGVDVTGKIYVSGLAAFPGDPEAWVSGRGDVERVIRARGWSCQGSLNIKGYDPEPAEDTRVADDLVADAVERRIESDPGLALMDRGELVHQTKEMIQPHWD